MPETLGIENIKKVLKSIIDIGENIAEVMEDKKVQWIELPGFIPELLQIPGALKAIPHLKGELADMSAVEKEELIAYIASELDLTNDKAEAAIENAVAVALAFVELINMFTRNKAEEVAGDGN